MPERTLAEVAALARGVAAPRAPGDAGTVTPDQILFIVQTIRSLIEWLRNR